MRAPAILATFGTALWWEDDALRLGASLAYYRLFAIAPVLLVATAIAGMVFGAETVAGKSWGNSINSSDAKARPRCRSAGGSESTTCGDSRHRCR